MKKALLLVLLVTCMLLAFTSCSKSDVPEGMRLVYGSESDGYYFYAPEEWTVNNYGEVKIAYASAIDKSSVSFVEVDASVLGENKRDYFFSNGEAPEGEMPDGYFKDCLVSFPEGTDVTIAGETIPFGQKGFAADTAKKYAYNYLYGKERWGFVQIFAEKDGRFFILTFSARMEVRSDSTTYFDYHAERLTSVIENFKFVEKKDTAEKEKEYKKDSDGYILISDEKYAQFDLYVSESFTPDFSSSVISATASDGSNITMSRSDTSNVYVYEYFNSIVDELKTVTKSDVEVKVGITNESKSIKFGNAAAAYECEYTYTYEGVKYHVYQVFVIDTSFAETLLNMAKGYIFTYTATEENYEKHLEEVHKTIEKVKF